MLRFMLSCIRNAILHLGFVCLKQINNNAYVRHAFSVWSGTQQFEKLLSKGRHIVFVPFTHICQTMFDTSDKFDILYTIALYSEK